MDTHDARKKLQAAIEGVELIPFVAEVIKHGITSRAIYHIGATPEGEQVARLASGNPSAGGWEVIILTDDQKKKVAEDDSEWELADIFPVADIGVAINNKTIFDSEAENEK